jgi:hypothetical protein
MYRSYSTHFCVWMTFTANLSITTQKCVSNDKCAAMDKVCCNRQYRLRGTHFVDCNTFINYDTLCRLRHTLFFYATRRSQDIWGKLHLTIPTRLSPKTIHSRSFCVFCTQKQKGHSLASNVCLFVHRNLDGNLAETVGCEHRKLFHFPQFAPLFFTLTSSSFLSSSQNPNSLCYLAKSKILFNTSASK